LLERVVVAMALTETIKYFDELATDLLSQKLTLACVNRKSDFLLFFLLAVYFAQ
jgi:hypothetical protein